MKAVRPHLLRAILKATIAVLTLQSWAAFATDQNDEQIVIQSIGGKVEIYYPGLPDWILASKGHVLGPRWRLRTGATGRATLQWSDQGAVTFGALTEIEILPPDESGANSGLNLFKGLLSFFHREEPGRIRVLTRGANASVRGTEFVMEVPQDATDNTILSVIDGEVAFTNAQGSITLTNRQQAVAREGVAPTRTAGFIVNQVIQWALYYPAVLDLNDLLLTDAERAALRRSLEAYATGDLLAALKAYPPGRTPESDEERIYYAALLLSVGQVSKAEAWLGELSADPVSERLSRLKDALRTLVAAVKLQPRPGAVAPELPTELLADSYYEQSQGRGDESLKAALGMAQAAANGSPDFGFAYARVAELELSFGRAEQAKAALRWARSFTPRNAHALAMQGFLLISENRTRQAIELFDQALAVDPAVGDAWLGRGLSRIRRGDKEGGREDLLMAAAMEPQRAILRSYLAKAYEDAADKGAAEKEIGFAKELDEKDPTAWLYSALINQQNNRINEATRDLEKSLELNDNRRLFRSEMLLDQDRAVRSANLASVYHDAGMDSVAIREAAKAVTYDYANSAAHLFMSDSYNDLRDPTRFNLRYETVWFNELLLANLLSPVGAGRLSQTLGQMPNVQLFETDGLGLASSTSYRSDGQVKQLSSVFGTFKNAEFAVDLDYQHNDGVRVNNELNRLELYGTIKQQLTPNDSVLLLAKYQDYTSGDNFQYYDPSDASPDFSFAEQQEPILVGGYQHEWSPSVRTLLLGGRLVNSQQFGASNVSRWWFNENLGGSIVAAPRPPFDVRLDSDLEIFTAELNQIVQEEWLTVVAGGLWQGGTFESSDLLTDAPIPLLFQTPPAAGSLDEPYNRLRGYGYLTVEPINRVWLTGGISYDYIEYPDNFRNPPISVGTCSRNLLGPKAAIVWSPAREVTFRGMFSRSLGGVSLDESYRLEPTQLAGFPQAFRTVISETLVGSVAAPEYEVMGLALDLKLASHTYAGLQVNRIESLVDQTIGIFRLANGSPPSIASTTPETLDYEEISFTASVNQLLGDYFSAGVAYQFTDARLQRQLPELAATGLPGAETTQQSYLHQPRGYVQYTHPSGLFVIFSATGYLQSNSGYDPDQPGDELVMLDAFVGYRLARRKLDLTFGVMNLTDTDYRLNSLTVYYELPRERVFTARLSFQF